MNGAVGNQLPCFLGNERHDVVVDVSLQVVLPYVTKEFFVFIAESVKFIEQEFENYAPWRDNSFYPEIFDFFQEWLLIFKSINSRSDQPDVLMQLLVVRIIADF